MRRGASYGMSCDDISLDVITISSWLSADEAKREIALKIQQKDFALLFQQSKLQSVATQPVASFAYSVDLVPRRKELKKEQSAAVRQEACKRKGRKYCSCVGTLQRSVAPKWKEDKIAIWSAEEFWKLSNGKNFYRGYILEATPIEEVFVREIGHCEDIAEN
ncbi:nuclear transcription factor Y subunit C-4 [Dorcoceras hygrometricum]|uniref:Nuclear transcription factor Y subunit C-4 n=1 Tax=Dorcoceras hygrometricum TaxID=472368 RepID=A0A2Z7A4K6_9LAMI|nr:nuclear transcription factor Y subunit C-4 [Dorcoceras hygrometricum]